MSRTTIAAMIAVVGLASPAFAQKPTNPVSADSPGKQMQGTTTVPADRGANHGASTYVPTTPPGQATRLTTPGGSATAPGKVK